MSTASWTIGKVKLTRIVELEAERTRRHFLGRYADQPVRVFGTHFAAPTMGFVVSHGDGWRLQVENGA